MALTMYLFKETFERKLNFLIRRALRLEEFDFFINIQLRPIKFGPSGSNFLIRPFSVEQPRFFFSPNFRLLVIISCIHRRT